MNNKVNKVLKKIEKLENKWNYILSEKEHLNNVFARTDKKSRVIKFWSVPKTTGKFLHFLVLLIKAKKILELGCSAGYSTIWMASALNLNKSQVYTTEILKSKIKIAEKNFEDSGLKNKITLIPKDIFEVLNNWKYGKLDLVFIDANKEDYNRYYKLVFPLVKSGGIIVADDVGNFKRPMKKFIDEVKIDRRIVYNFLNFDNGLMLIYKK